MNAWLIILIVFFSSFVLTNLIRRYTLKKNLIDLPNDRSLHTIPTPRGGGLSIVVTFFVAISFVNSLSQDIYIALVGSGVLIAVIGFWDDHGHIAARWRLLSHFVAAAWVIFWLGEVPEFQLFGFSIDAGWIGMVIVAFFLVWLLNLFNFMDGIDGIAASETIFVSCSGAYFSWVNGFESLSFLSFLLAVSTTGFLILNWFPAKIFMGDVGSSFLGLMLGVIAYVYIIEGGLIWIWLILLAIFLVDSGVTLIRRVLNGERWYEAHCSHAYQNAARKWVHKKVTVSVIIINLFWLLPLAVISQLMPDLGLWIMLLAFTPLIVVALKFKAGITDTI